MTAVPQAIVAETLQGREAIEFTQSWTTATRPAAPVPGQMGFNTTTDRIESWTGAAWEQKTPAFSTTTKDGTATDNDVMRWNDTNNEWEPMSVGTLLGSAAGDLTGTWPNIDVVGLDGNPVSLGALAGGDTGKVLKWNGTQWIADTDNGGTIVTGGTANRVTKFNATGDNVEDSTITDDGVEVDFTIPLNMNTELITGVGTSSGVSTDAVNVAYLEGYVNPGVPATPFLKWNDTNQAWEASTLVAADISDLDLTDYVLRDGTTPLTGNWNVGGFDITNIGYITQANNKYLGLSRLTAGEELALEASFDGAPDPTVYKGMMWFNSATNKIMYYDGADAQPVAMGGAGSVASVNSASGAVTLGTSVTSGTDTGPDWNASTTLNIPLASDAATTVGGLLTHAEYTTLNNKQDALAAGTIAGQYLVWDDTNNVWEPASVTVASDITSAYDEAGNLTITVTKIQANPVDNTVLANVAGDIGKFFRWDGTEWVSVKLSVTDLSGVITEVEEGTADDEMLVWNDTAQAWEPMTVSGDVSIAHTYDSGAPAGTSVTTVTGIRGQSLDTTLATLNNTTDVGKILKWDGAKWIADVDAGAAGTIAILEGANSNTVDLAIDTTGTAPTNWSLTDAVTDVVTLNIPEAKNAAAGATLGLISKTDYDALANKQDALTDGTDTDHYLKWDGDSWEPAFVSKLYESDGGAAAVTVDATGNTTFAGNASVTGDVAVTGNTALTGTLQFDAGQAIDTISTETDLDDGAGASNSVLSTQLAVKTYVDTAVGAIPDFSDGTVDGQILVWDQNDLAWEPVTTAQDLSMTDTGVATVTGIRGKLVTTTAPASMGQIYYYDSAANAGSGEWKLADMTGLADGYVLKWDDTGKVWKVGADAGAAGTVASLQGLTGTLDFAIRTDQTSAAAWDAADADTVRLSIPEAKNAAAGGTLGLISKTDYDALAAKQDAITDGTDTDHYLKWDGDSWEPAFVSKLYESDGGAAAVTVNATGAATFASTMQFGAGQAVGTFSTETDLDDGAGAANTAVPTQLAVKTYVDTITGAIDGLPTGSADGAILYWDQSGSAWVETAAPTDNQILKWDDATDTWIPEADAGGTTIAGGTQHYVAKFNATGDNVVNSQIYDNGTNVGIGTTSPTSRLTIFDATGMQKMYFDGATFSKYYSTETNPRYALTADWKMVDGVNTLFTGLYNGASNVSGSFAIGNVNGNGHNWSTGIFVSDGTDYKTKLALDSNGKVGVGTMTPGSQVSILRDISLDSVWVGQLSLDSTASTDNTVQTRIVMGSVARIEGVVETGATPTGGLAFTTRESAGAMTEKIRISANGNTGIGTTTPNEKLTVSGNLSLAQQGSAPSNTADFGKLYVTGDGASQKLYFKNENNDVFDLTLAGGGGTVSSLQTLTGAIDFAIRTDQTSAAAWDTADTDTVRLSIPEAKNAAVGGTLGLISKTDYAALAAKQDAITDGTNTDHYLKWDGDSWEPAFVSKLYESDGGAAAVTVNATGAATFASTMQFGAGQAVGTFSTETDLDDGAGAANTVVPTQLAVKTYVDTVAGAIDGLPAGSADGAILYWDQSGSAWVETAAPTDNQILKWDDATDTWIPEADAGGTTIAGGTQHYVAKFNATGDNVVDSQIYDDGTNVGIGTASPGAQLHVTGNVRTGSGYQIIDGTQNWGIEAWSGYLAFQACSADFGSCANKVFFNGNGHMSFTGAGPTAVIDLKAGSATAGTAPIKLTSGPLNSTAEAGAIEFLNNNLYYTGTDNSRRTIATTSGSGAVVDGTGTANYIPKFSDSDTIANSNITDDNTTISTAAAKHVNMDSGTFYLDSTNNRVGIGTATPYAQLHVGAGTGARLTSPADDTFPAITAATRSTGGEIRAQSSLNADYGTLIMSAGGEASLAQKMSLAIKGYGATDGAQARFLNGNTPIMTILGSGNVGIGTTTPTSFKLEVAGSIGPSATTSYNLGSLTRRFSTTYSTNVDVTNVLGQGAINVLSASAGTGSDGAGYGVTVAGGSGDSACGGAYCPGGNIRITGGAAGGGGSAAGNVVLAHDGTNPVGNVGIGVTTPQTKLQVAGVISPSVNNTYSLGDATYRFTEVFATNGVINTSDRREKKDIYDTDLGLDFINKLRPVSYRWNTGVDDDVRYGLIAQETEQAIAEARQDNERTSIVTHDEKTDRYGVRYSELISPLIKAVQELYHKIMGIDRDIASIKAEKADQEALNAVKAESDAKIQKLEAENAELKTRLEKIEKMLNSK